MKLFYMVAIILLANSGLHARNQKSTALYIESPRDDFGSTIVTAYFEGQDGHFTIVRENQGISINFMGNPDFPTWWNLDFSAPDDERLKPGCYKNVRWISSDDDQPGFILSGSELVCNELSGVFEILEIKYDTNGEIESFAANFFQNCETNLTDPLLGSIRYNSSFPLEARFKEFFAPSSLMQLIECDESNNYTVVDLTNKEAFFEILSLPYGGNGVEIRIDSKEHGQWCFDFSIPEDEKLACDEYRRLYCRYPFQNSFDSAMRLSLPSGEYCFYDGEFEIEKFERGPDEKINSIALKFTAHTKDHHILEVNIRVNSKFPPNTRDSFFHRFHFTSDSDDDTDD